MKTTNPLGKLFGKNPFSALQRHMRVVLACLEEVPALFQALIDHDKERLSLQQRMIFEREQEADALRRDLRRHLPRTLFLPVDRRDLVDLLGMQDRIADTAQDMAGLVIERYMAVPPSIEPHLMPFVEQCVGTCRSMASIIEHLDELLETGFSGPEADEVLTMIGALYDAEDVADEGGIKIARALFAEEDTLDPVTVVFWYQMIQLIGNLADHAEAAGERLELMLASR